MVAIIYSFLERLSKGTVKQAHVINLLCDVQVFSTVYGCCKHDVY